MAFDFNMTRLLLHEWRSSGENLGETVVLGRQGLHVSPDRLQRNLNEYGITNINSEEILQKENGYFEPFLKIMGASKCESIDVSHYEGASLILDMNTPLDSSLYEKYDTVIDSGSLEHIFNFPMAIRNCLNLARLNGRVIIITPTNNFSGHGFYQFSPELFYRVFSEQNGYQVEKMILYEDEYHAKWYSVTDPEKINQRIEFTNSKPTYLFVVARRSSIKEVFASFPNQSDYNNVAWNTIAKGPYEIMGSMRRKLDLQKKIPYPIRKIVQSTRERLRQIILLFSTIDFRPKGSIKKL